MAKDKQQISKEMFEPVELTAESSEKIEREQLTYWQDAWVRIRKNKVTLFWMFVLILIAFMSILGPYMNKHGFDDQNLRRSMLPPKIPVLEHVSWLGLDGKETRQVESKSVEDAVERFALLYGVKEEFFTYDVIQKESNGQNAIVEFTTDKYGNKGFEEAYFWFGTDQLGRDLWTRTWQGTRISLYIAILAAAIDMVVGVAYGGISAYYGGRVDNYMQRVIEVLVGIPNLVVVILMILVLEPGILSITLALTITGWIGMARVVRGNVLKLKNQEFVLASKTLGAKDSRIIMKNLVPNVTGIIIITTMFTIPGAIFFEAFLSFIGLGLQPPIASLGTLIDDAFKSFQTHPYMLLWPSVVISLIMIAFNVVSDGLRDALDPKMRD